MRFQIPPGRVPLRKRLKKCKVNLPPGGTYGYNIFFGLVINFCSSDYGLITEWTDFPFCQKRYKQSVAIMNQEIGR